jgi:DNA-binding CsgD family transcriptional regulator
VGKTSLVRRFCESRHRSVRVLSGACEPLTTPRPLGPFVDFAGLVGGELEELVAGGGRPHQVVSALMRDLGANAGTVVVLEDMHWADEATLDALRLLGRRIGSVPALVLASYRDDQLDRAHPLRIVIGELGGGETIVRLRIEPLSQAAVAELARPHGVDAEELYRVTGGNPFFVTEALAAGAKALPQSVRDAVLARAARLSAHARSLLAAIAVIPQETEVWLLEALVGENVDRLEECLASGMLTSGQAAAGFRHELARLTIEQSLPADRRTTLHRKALAALLAPPTGVQDLDRLSHHAEAACDAQAVLRFAPAAGERAASLGAHREAAAQYARALRFAENLPLGQRAELLDRCARECTLVGRLTNAVELRQQAITCHRESRDRRREGDSLAALSWPLWAAGRTEEAMDAGRRAVGVLEPLGHTRELARACGTLLMLSMAADDAEGGLAWGRRALKLAQRVDDVETLVSANTNLGGIEFLRGVGGGRERVEKSLQQALEAGLESEAAHAFTILARACVASHEHALADRYLDAGIEYCERRDLDSRRPYLIATRAELELERGRWSQAGDSAALVMARRGSGLASVLALAVLGKLRARRGDPELWQPLDEALGLAEIRGEPHPLAAVAVGRAEAAWLEGRHEIVARETQTALELTLARGASQLYGELLCWRWRVGIGEQAPPHTPAPYALELAGDWARAAALWRELGCPYKAALALSDAEDEKPLREAHAQLTGLGAAPAAAIVARKLRERGARGLPRGPRPRTRENPAGLTARELEVLALLADGLRNAQIAERLVVSAKTVDHHVSAILRKLDVRTRGEAGAEALRLGLAGQDR